MSQYGATDTTDYAPGPRGVKGRPCAIISLLMAVGLLGLFFMPWLTVSCDGQAVMASAPPEVRHKAAAFAQQTGVPQSRLTEKKTLARASGWALAAGTLTPAEELAGNPNAMQPTGNNKGPKSRWWVYMGLALPALLVLICGFAAVGSLPARAGKWMLLLGLTGLIFMIVVSRVDYIDDAIDQAYSDMPRSTNMCNRSANRLHANAKAQLERTGTQMKKIIKTDATVYLWVSLGLYGAIAAAGLVAVMSVDPAAIHPSRAAARGPTERRCRADQEAGAMPGFGPEIYQPGTGESGWRGGQPSSTPSAETEDGPVEIRHS